MDAVREPIVSDLFKLYSRTPTVQPVDLLEVNAIHPLSELTDEQRNIMTDLGIRKDNLAAVHFGRSSIEDAVVRLGDAVEATRFSAELPVWE